MPDTPTPEPTPAAQREWEAHTEQIMRGLAHALNNRAAALSAIRELLREPDDDPAMTQTILNTEFERLRQLADTVRALGPGRTDAEAISPSDVIPGVGSLLTLHAGQRERTFAFDCEGAPPVRVPRWMFLRALVALCAAAPTSDRTARTVHVALSQDDDDWLAVRVAPPPEGAGTQSVYVAELARAMGGEAFVGGFRIPTLDAVRRRAGP